MKISQLKAFKKIEQLEQLYSHTLSQIDKKFEPTFMVYFRIIKTYASLHSFTQSLKLKSPASSAGEINLLLDDYLKAMGDIHRITLLWLRLFMGLTWPDQIASKEMRRWQKQHPKSQWNDEMPAFFLELKARRDAFPVNSTQWIENHKKIIDKAYDELAHHANENKQRINHCFKKVLYTQSDLKHMAIRQQVIDWIAGYKNPTRAENALEHLVDHSLTDQLKFCEKQRSTKLILRYSFLIFMTILLSFGIHSTRIDRAVYVFAKDGLLKLCRLDPASINFKQKKEYFNEFIVNLDSNASTKQISGDLNLFISNRLYKNQNGTYYFADKILSPFFLILSRQEIPPSLKSRVINAAGLLNGNIKKPVADIIGLFDQSSLPESELRNHILELRRAFVKQGIFPFTFIVVKNDIPYLFLFPERIIEKLALSSKDLYHLGINEPYYSPFVTFPLHVYVVQGKRYPFKDRAGYFEGEFAVVFSDLAAKTEWTAWHEFGHIIDQIRFIYGHKPLPKNIETNAVLFPAIFAQDAKTYLLKRIFPIIETADPQDAYVQASKGILNGINLCFSKQKGMTKMPLITDQFRINDIRANEGLIQTLSKDQIKNIALSLYQDPDQYLKTAEPGQYHGIISNAEEIVAGTPRAPHQGFILTGFGKVEINEKSKMKFIFDDNGDDQDSIWGRSFFDFLEQAFLSIFNGRNERNSSTAQNIIAALLIFLIVEMLFYLPHLLGTPLRKRKFYGQKTSDMVNGVYKDHPISDGRSFGQLIGEKYLLNQIHLQKENLTEDLKQEIAAFKSTLPVPRRALFDTLLMLAPFNPLKSRIVSKWHDFLFWLPFLGPVTARNPRIFKKQESFWQWETFNKQLILLAKKLDNDTPQDIFKQSYAKIIKNFKDTQPSFDLEGDQISTHLEETEESIFFFLNELKRIGGFTRPIRTRRFASIGDQNGDFDHLAPYTYSDDIKRIDWKSTARSPNFEVKVKKHAGFANAQIDFLIDFRSLAKQQARETIARDFVQALQILNFDSELKTLMMIMPTGEIRQKALSLKSHTNSFNLSTKIWMIIKKEFEDYQKEHQDLTAHGLKFYTPGENRLYRQIIKLTDFDMSQGPSKKLPLITPRSFNIYLIGLKRAEDENIWQLLSKNHQLFYWQ